MSIRKIALALAFAPVFAVAQVTTIGPFTGALQEGWETTTAGQFLASYPILGGAGNANQISAGQGLLVTGGWGFFSTIFPHGGAQFMGGAGVNYEFVFNTPAFQFGGYFGTNADVPDATATFFDASNVQIGSAMPVSAPLGQWAWNGWEYAAGISRIEIRANNQFGGFIMCDDLEYNAVVPEPAAIIGLALGIGMLALRRRHKA